MKISHPGLMLYAITTIAAPYFAVESIRRL
jgi:hypothetical protein